MKNRSLIIATLLIVSAAVIFLWAKSAQNSPESKEVIRERMIKHSADIKIIDAQWEILHQAYKFEEAKQYDKAINLFQQAVGVGDQNVPRNALVRIYEKTGEYEKALEQIEWFLKGNQNEQGRIETLAAKDRILNKIQESKPTQTASTS